MAIQVRRGIFDKFDKTRLLPGEYAVVLSGDPVARDGRAVYVCFAAGSAKRLATHEDMYDFLVDARDDTIEYIETVATADVRADYADIVATLTSQEATRVSNELSRVANEAERVESEEARETNETQRVQAETARQATITAFETKVENGYFNGATFIPDVSDFGVLSWTNNKGLDNPTSVNIKGEKGNDGAVTSLDAGMYVLQIKGNDLYLIYGDDAEVPDLSIGEDGCLYLSVEGV